MRSAVTSSTRGTMRDTLPPRAVAVIATIDRPPGDAFAARMKSTDPPVPEICRPATRLRIDLTEQVHLDRRIDRYESGKFADHAHFVRMVGAAERRRRAAVGQPIEQRRRTERHAGHVQASVDRFRRPVITPRSISAMPPSSIRPECRPRSFLFGERGEDRRGNRADAGLDTVAVGDECRRRAGRSAAPLRRAAPAANGGNGRCVRTSASKRAFRHQRASGRCDEPIVHLRDHAARARHRRGREIDVGTQPQPAVAVVRGLQHHDVESLSARCSRTRLASASAGTRHAPR